MSLPAPSGSLPPKRRATLVSRHPTNAWGSDSLYDSYPRRYSSLVPQDRADHGLGKPKVQEKNEEQPYSWENTKIITNGGNHAEGAVSRRALSLAPPSISKRPTRKSFSSFQTRVDEICSVVRRMSISLRSKGNRSKQDIDNASHAHLLSHEKSFEPDTINTRPKTAAGLFRSHTSVPRRPSMPSIRSPFEEAAPPRPSMNNFVPGRGGAPPIFPEDVQHGAAARAAAAAQNEAAGRIIPSSQPFSSVKMTRDSESGIGIDIRDRSMVEDIPYTAMIRRDPLTVLPLEIMEQIMSCLDASSLLQAAQVSRLWNARANSRHAWRLVFQRTFNPQRKAIPTSSSGCTPAMGLGKASGNQDWKRMYFIRQRLAKRWEQGEACAIYLNGHKDSVYCVQFDEDKIITGSRDQTIRIWDARTYQCLRILGAPSLPHGSYPPPAAISAPLSTTSLQPFCSINATSEDQFTIRNAASFDYHHASILCLQFDSEIMVSGSSDFSCIVWNMKDYTPIRRLIGHTAGVLDVCFDSRYIITCSKDTTICAWSRKTGELIKKLCGHRGPVNAVQLRGDLVASASGDGMAKLWNLRSGLCIKEFPSRDRGLACVDFSEDGTTILAGGNDRVVYQFDTNTGALVRELKGHKDLVRSLHLDSVNNRIVSGSYDMSVKVWDGDGKKDAISGGFSLDFQGWTSSWILAAKSDYRRIVATSQDGRAVIVDFGYGLPGANLLEAS
ncbi:MAG: hypothetical protein Q9160_001447 [Pyrenula sp. 1 TL-2023]